MDSERLKQILRTPEVVEVLYQNAPVWIENIKDDQRASIKVLDTDEQLIVPVEQLTEGEYLT